MHYNTKQNNNKNKHKPSKNKHKLNIIISKIISSNYKNNYLYLTLGCKGHGIQDIPQRSQYHAVVH